MNKKVGVILLSMIVCIFLIVVLAMRSGLGSVITSVSFFEEKSQKPQLIVLSTVCDRNFYDCKDFERQADAQNVLETCGGAVNDVHMLDRDNDGIACEILLYGVYEDSTFINQK